MDPASAGLIEFSAYFGGNNRQDPGLSNYLPTLKQLQYLAALKEHGHFGRAAESCFVTQSTLSAGLRELESLLGVTLVERTRRVVRFTPLGDAIVAKAHQVLRGAEELSTRTTSQGPRHACHAPTGCFRASTRRLHEWIDDLDPAGDTRAISRDARNEPHAHLPDTAVYQQPGV